MDQSPTKKMQPALPPIAGVKRPAPSLLPAFEPLSSSPSLPRPSKRPFRSSTDTQEASYQKYPTPMPTSTTGILSSSPPRLAPPSMKRDRSTASERAPLAAVPSITLPENGDELLMGRSSNSSHYQLSNNRLISRVHVKARFIPASEPLKPNKIEIECNGWNGVRVHCQGRTWELAKGDSFTSETESAEVMLDVQDARVIIGWPSRESKDAFVEDLSDSSWDSEGSPTRRLGARNGAGQEIPSSPLRNAARTLKSPESPSPAGPPVNASMSTLFAGSTVMPASIKVYEDEHTPSHPDRQGEMQQSPMKKSVAKDSKPESTETQESPLSDLSDLGEMDPDEENDPIITSFGPFGANLSSAMRTFTATSPATTTRRGRRLTMDSEPADESESVSANEVDDLPVVNHVINQLAFSRLSSTPLSTIMNNLPASLKDGTSLSKTENGLTKEDLAKLLNKSACVGEIQREGKDAAGKPLESEYYYIPEEDHDEERKATVVESLRKPTLRNCRKQHKVCFCTTVSGGVHWGLKLLARSSSLIDHSHAVSLC